MRRAHSLFTLSLLLSPLLSASIIDHFNLSKNLTRGELLFRRGLKSERLTFGTTSGYYGIGFFLPADTLPEPYRARFKGQLITEVLLGNLTPGERAPQFGTIILIHDEKNLKLKVPGKTGGTEKDVAFVQMSSPSIAAKIGDEERLKGNYFASQGFVTLGRIGKSEKFVASFSDRRLRFTQKYLKIEVNALLGTPFNPESADIKGIIEVPVFAPGSDDTVRFLSAMLAETMASPLVAAPDRSLTGR